MKSKLFILGLACSLLFFVVGQTAFATQPNIPPITDPTQQQIKNILGNLGDSEAEHVSGAYVPGLGAVITIDVLRGPNSIKDKPAYKGTFDWGIYLMQTFGAKLTAVPAEEAIAFSITFYDYNQAFYHQLVFNSRAGDIADPSKYKVWLDGKPYNEVVSQIEAAGPADTGQTGSPTPQPAPTTPAPAKTGVAISPKTSNSQVVTTTTTTPVNITSAITSPSGVATNPPAQPSPVLFGGPFKFGGNLQTGQTATGDWVNVNGQWDIGNQGITQSKTGLFDLISYYNKPVRAPYQLQVETQYLEGDMGAGLVFNAPASNIKNGAQLVSYAGKGTYLQWGYFDNTGLFQFQGGSVVSNSSDGKPHTISVKLAAKTYQVTLDGKIIGQNIPLASTDGGFSGLLASTSKVLFTKFILESI